MGGNTNCWVVKDDDDDEISDSVSIGSNSEDSMDSVSSSLSSELAEDASFSTSSSHSNGPLYELSELINHLPIKRGLSMYYEGKAQSFTSLGMVKSIEDLPKKESPYRKKLIKSCKSYGGGLDGARVSLCTSPKASISKKASSSKGSLVSRVTGRGSFLGDSPISIEESF